MRESKEQDQLVKSLLAENLMMKARIKELETRNDLRKITASQEKIFECTYRYLRGVDQNIIDDDNSGEEDDEDEDDDDDEEEDLEYEAGKSANKNHKMKSNPIIKNAKIDKVINLKLENRKEYEWEIYLFL